MRDQHATTGRGEGRALVYRRVSTAEQAGSGLGLEAQTAAVTALAGRLGLTVAATFDDLGVSGGARLEQRPGLLAAIAALKKGDRLLIAKRDRLGRSVINVAMIERLVERRGARIVSAAGEGTDDDGPTSVLMRQIVDAFAQYERAIIRSRTKAALQAKLARGERAGEIRYGLRLAPDGKRLEPDPDEQRALARMWELRGEGLTCRQIADRLADEGILTRRGTRWREQYVSERLRREPRML